MRITYFFVFIVFFYISSCGVKKDKPEESEVESATADETASSNTAGQSWIDDSEMDVLSNTWVAEDDKGELSSTWTEDAYAEELNTSSGLANSWVDESGETVHAKAEIPPEFIGGKEALFNYPVVFLFFPWKMKLPMPGKYWKQ